ncbi:geranylgeranyl reductase family protein [Micropruina sp.]|uniref:geranylgeranyl reductase family protein n=1 Tax=Micropruina sp. TaxID=2737536 RepID=UPI0039E535AB
MPDEHADVVVVGAGPAGASTACWLADQGLSVALLEKGTFPRDKVCGDGLTPRATKQLLRLGIDVSPEAGWLHNKGLRVYGGRAEPFELPWPTLGEFPSFGLVRKRADFDQLLADHAVAKGATLYQQANVTGAIVDQRTDRVTGVTTKDGRSFSAPIVVAADGNSSPVAKSLGLLKNARRPMGVACRTYFTSPRHDDDWMESWLELWDGKPGESNLLPGYGWIFGMGDGTCNVGLGTVASTAKSQKLNYRGLLQTWLANTPSEWGFSPDNQVGPISSAALPMAFNRKPAYTRGLVLVGDSGGMVSPFNGEGIPYAMEAGEAAAEAIVRAHAEGVGSAAAEKALHSYPARLSAEWGGYFRLGQVFVNLIEHPQVMRLCTRYGLPRPVLMRFTIKLLAHLYDTKDGDWMDRVIHALSRAVPAA